MKINIPDILAAGILFSTLSTGLAQENSSMETAPFVKGGVYDKPYLTRAGRISIGGYADAQFRFEREGGVTEEMTFVAQRFNLFTFAPVSDRVRVISEIEFEEGGGKIALELAMLDFEIHQSLTFRAGVLLCPIGRFNLSHDSPINPMVDRPLVSTEIIPSTLSETGMGFYGAIFPSRNTRVIYELYGVNGLNDGIINTSEGGTRLSNGKHNFEDNNNHPSLASRVAVSPIPQVEVGFSTLIGPYNVFDAEGLEIDDKRNLNLYAFDGEVNWKSYYLNWEVASASIDIYPHLRGIYAGRQSGFYLDAGARFFEGKISNLPGSLFIAAFRIDAVDFDAKIDGDDQRQITLGLNFKPVKDTVFKFNYVRSWASDRFNVETPSASILVGVATYF